jgi:hypothetical protein
LRVNGRCVPRVQTKTRPRTHRWPMYYYSRTIVNRVRAEGML